jgi:hypothetical protein
LATGRPVIAVSGDWKIEAFMETAGLGDWVVGASDCSQLPQLLAIADQQPSVSGHLRASVEENRAVAAEARALLQRSRP